MSRSSAPGGTASGQVELTHAVSHGRPGGDWVLRLVTASPAEPGRWRAPDHRGAPGRHPRHLPAHRIRAHPELRRGRDFLCRQCVARVVGAAASRRLLERAGAGDVSDFGPGNEGRRRKPEWAGLRECVRGRRDRNLGVRLARETCERRAGGGWRGDALPVGAGAGAVGGELPAVHHRHELQPAGIRASGLVDHRILSAAPQRSRRAGWPGRSPRARCVRFCCS